MVQILCSPQLLQLVVGVERQKIIHAAVLAEDLAVVVRFRLIRVKDLAVLAHQGKVTLEAHQRLLQIPPQNLIGLVVAVAQGLLGVMPRGLVVMAELD
jgi:hypothetical protein